MTSTSVTAAGRVAPARPSVRTSGTVLVVTGLAGAAAGLLLALWPRETSVDHFSYPLGETSHLVFQLFFAVHHVGLVVGVVALAVLAGRSDGWVRAGLGLAVAGLAGLSVVEAVVAFAGAGITVDSDRAGALGAAYGVVTLMIGVGLVVAGAVLARRPVLAGRGRWLPLVLGAWVFVPMMPALFAPMVWGRLAIIGWMLLFADLGLSLRRAGTSAT